MLTIGVSGQKGQIISLCIDIGFISEPNNKVNCLVAASV